MVDISIVQLAKLHLLIIIISIIIALVFLDSVGGPMVPTSNVTQVVGIYVATTVVGHNGIGFKITDHLYDLINSLR